MSGIAPSVRSSVRHLEILDYVRGVAILAVLIFHTLGMAFGFDALPWKGWGRDFSGQTSFLYFLPVGMIGQAGVAIFFVISGFCIHLSFQQQGKQWAGFFIRRFFRIFPPYLLALILAVVILWTNPGLDIFNHEFWTQLLAHVFLVHNFHPSTIYGFNPSLWSLAVEAQLYLLYPVLLMLAGRVGWRKAMLVLGGCEFLIRALDGWMQTMAPANSGGGQIVWLLANSPLGYWFSWALGACMADAWLSGRPQPFSKVPPLLILALACGSHFVKPLCVFQFPMFALATAIIVDRALSQGRPQNPAPAFSLQLLKRIGLWSYSIYLLHQPLLHVYSHLIVWAVPSQHRPAPVSFLLVVVTWLAVIPFSAWWYELIEVPGIALGKWIIRKTGKAPPLAERTKSASGRFRTGHVLTLVALLVSIAISLWISDRFSVRGAMRNSDAAWTLATSPEVAKRNGVLAVKLAEEACLQTQYRYPSMIGTLAAAYAEAGRFDEAIGAAQVTGKMAAQAGDEPLLRRSQEMERLFSQRLPFREPSATNANGPGPDAAVRHQ